MIATVKPAAVIAAAPINGSQGVEATAHNHADRVARLRATIRNLPDIDLQGRPVSEQAWRKNLKRLHELILQTDPRSFLSWDIIRYTMFVGDMPYVGKELAFLAQRSDWRARWRDAIHESQVGDPLPYMTYPDSSGNLIHLAYHLAQFEQKTALNIGEMSVVFEFGGGYGAMCRLFHNLNFHGRYVLFDFPELSALQRYYLETLGLPVCDLDTFRQSVSGILCISEMEALREILSDCVETHEAMFVGTWSICEAPIEARETVLPLIVDFKAFLLTYGERLFDELNNREYFQQWSENLKEVDWQSWEIPHLLKNYYLVGSRKKTVDPRQHSKS